MIKNRRAIAVMSFTVNILIITEIRLANYCTVNLGMTLEGNGTGAYYKAAVLCSA